MPNGGHGIRDVNFSWLMDELERLGVELPKPRWYRPWLEMENPMAFAHGVEAVSDFCYTAATREMRNQRARTARCSTSWPTCTGPNMRWNSTKRYSSMPRH